MFKNEYKQRIIRTGVILLCAFLIVPVLGKGGNSSRSGGRSGSTPKASQANSSRGSSHDRAASQPSTSRAMSAPSQSRPSVSSTLGRQSTAASQPRSVESRPASPQSSRPSAVEQPSRSVSSSAPASVSTPASTSTNTSSRGRAVSSRPVQRTVEVTGTAKLNRSSSASAQKSVSSSSTAVSGRSGRVIASAVKAQKAEPKATPASVTRKIEPSVSRSVSQKSKTSSQAATNKDVRSTGKNDKGVKTQSQRDTGSSSSVTSGMTEKTQKTTTTSGQVRTIDKTVVASRTPTTTDRSMQRSTSSEKISKRIHAGRSDRSKTGASPTTVASIADGTKTMSAPSLNDGLRREGRGDSRQRSGAPAGDVTRATGVNRDAPRISQSGMDSGRSVTRDRVSQPRVVVNNTNDVVVQGDITRTHARPRLPRQLSPDVNRFHHDSRWQRHDFHHDGHHDHHDSHSSFYFSFGWSSFSCGRVAYFPYSYYHSWCHYPVGHYGFSYYYPGYHRRYIFVSLGGYWPEYRYPRYYWYGCHPYYWYGPDVVYYPSEGVTYNTYNYYTTDNTPAQTASTPYYELGNPKSAETTQPVDEPEFQTAADLCFERAVDLFEAGNYKDAVAQFREGVILSPEDVVLPFTYAQALFANGDYALAAGVLRAAVAQIPDDELTIYYPRGLYKDEKVLNEQVAQLEKAVTQEPFSADYQLLLGYQYMGLGDLDKAHGPLTEAAKDAANQPTVAKLMELAAKLQAEPESDDTVK